MPSQTATCRYTEFKEQANPVLFSYPLTQYPIFPALIYPGYPTKLKTMKRKNSIKNIFAVSGVLLLITAASPVKAEDNTATTGDVKIYELDMNDQNPLETLKESVIHNRADYDAAVNLSQIDMNASTITTDTFDRTKTGLQNININVTVNKKDSTEGTTGYQFSETAAVRMVSPSGPQVILKAEEVTVDLGGTFTYGDNIGYVSSTDGKLPAIRENDNVDVNTEGTYTCNLEFIDASGKSSAVSYTVNVKKPEEIIRAEEEAKRAEEAARIVAEQQAQAQQEAAERQQILAALQASNGSYTGSGNDIVSFAMSYLGYPYVWGGTSPSGFDCSGFTQYVYSHFGISLPRTSYQQELCGTIVSPAEAQPGDLVTYNDHSAIYIGNGQTISAMSPDAGIAIAGLYSVPNGNLQIHRIF